jgi:glycosyltransferase involved in cell wall biosynthesis
MGSPVAIALFTSSLHASGAGHAFQQVVRGLGDDRFQVHVATGDPADLDALARTVGPRSAAAFPVDGFAKTEAIRQARAFGRWCQEHRIALVHTMDRSANIFGLPAALLAGIPVRVGSRREADRTSSAAVSAIHRAALACAQVVVADSESSAQRLRQERQPADRIQVIPDPIETVTCAEREGPPSIRRVVALAPRDVEPAYARLLDAAPLVVRRCPDIEFVLVGAASWQAELESRAQLRGVAGHVHFAPSLDRALLASADLAVLPADTAADPHAVLHAMAAGLPVVGIRGGALDEHVHHQRTGVLIARDDARSLAFALLDLVHWPEHAARLGRTARACVQSRHSCDRVVAALAHLYLAALDAHARLDTPASQTVAS